MVNCFHPFLKWLWPRRFVRYRPAPRLGTRRIERRLLRRLAYHLAEAVR